MQHVRLYQVKTDLSHKDGREHAGTIMHNYCYPEDSLERRKSVNCADVLL